MQTAIHVADTAKLPSWSACALPAIAPGDAIFMAGTVICVANAQAGIFVDIGREAAA